MKHEKTKETKESKSSTAGKISKLQNQYNKILVELFEQFAAESIEEALEQNTGSFGENISNIVQCALDCLKTKVLEELGVNASEGGMAVGIAIDGVIGHDEETETPEEEAEESEAEQAIEDMTGTEEHDEEAEDEESEDDDKEEVTEESTSQIDKRLSAARRSDQVCISEAYSKMYKK